jgi:hypothetical protein
MIFCSFYGFFIVNRKKNKKIIITIKNPHLQKNYVLPFIYKRKKKLWKESVITEIVAKTSLI